MKQIEIDYFWPLTEQLALDLDYSVCEKPPVLSTKIDYANVPSHLYMLSDSNVTFSTTLNIDNVTITSEKKIGWFGRKLYDIMGLKCESKN
jgi:hypothetical protein